MTDSCSYPHTTGGPVTKSASKLDKIVSPIYSLQDLTFSTATSTQETPPTLDKQMVFKLTPYFPRQIRRLIPKLEKWNAMYDESCEPPCVVLCHVLLAAFMLEEMVESDSTDPSMLSVCSYLISRSAVPVSTLTYAVLLTERALRHFKRSVVLSRFELVAIFSVALICSSQLLEDRPLKHLVWGDIFAPLGISREVIASYSRQLYQLLQWRLFISENKYVNACRLGWRRVLKTTEWREVLFQIITQSGTLEPCPIHQLGNLWVILEWKPSRPVEPIRGPHTLEPLNFSGSVAPNHMPYYSDIETEGSHESSICDSLEEKEKIVASDSESFSLSSPSEQNRKTEDGVASQDYGSRYCEKDTCIVVNGAENDHYSFEKSVEEHPSPSPLEDLKSVDGDNVELSVGGTTESEIELSDDLEFDQIEIVFSPLTDGEIRGLPELNIPIDANDKLPKIPSATLRHF